MTQVNTRTNVLYYLRFGNCSPNPTLREVTKEWGVETLRHDLEVLGLQDSIICDRDLRWLSPPRSIGFPEPSRLHFGCYGNS